MSWSPRSPPSSSPAPVVVIIHASGAPQVVHIHLHPHVASNDPHPPSTSTPPARVLHATPPGLRTPTLRDNQPAPGPVHRESPPRPGPAWRRVQSSPALPVSAGDPFAESEQWFTLHAHRPPSTHATHSPTWFGPTEPAWRSVRREQGLELFVDSPTSPALFPQPERRQPEPEPEPQQPAMPLPQQMQMHQLHHEQQLRPRPRRAYVETDTEHEQTDTDTLSTRSRSVVTRLIHLTDTDTRAESRAESVLHLRRSEATIATQLSGTATTATRVSDTTAATRLSDSSASIPIRTVPVSHPENDDTEPEPENDGGQQEEQLFEAARALWAQTHQEDERAQEETEQEELHMPSMPEATHWTMHLAQSQAPEQQQQFQEQQHLQQQPTLYPAQTPYYTAQTHLDPIGQFSRSQPHLESHARPPIQTQPVLAQLTPTSLDEPLLPRPSQSRSHSHSQAQHLQSQSQSPRSLLHSQLYPHPHPQAQAQLQQTQPHFQFQPQRQPHSPRAQLYPHSQSPRDSQSPRSQLNALLHSHAAAQLQLQPAAESQYSLLPNPSGGSSLNPFLSPPPPPPQQPQRRAWTGAQRPNTWHEQSQPQFAPFDLGLGAGVNELVGHGHPVGFRPGGIVTEPLSPPRNSNNAPQSPPRRHPALTSPLAGSGSVYRPPSAHVPPSPNLHLTHALGSMHMEPWNWVDHPHPQAQWGVVPS